MYLRQTEKIEEEEEERERGWAKDQWYIYMQKYMDSQHKEKTHTLGLCIDQGKGKKLTHMMLSLLSVIHLSYVSSMPNL